VFIVSVMGFPLRLFCKETGQLLQCILRVPL